jgi:DNA polymerase III delta prime subunit
VVYILQAHVFAPEAQHALLKILEEPPAHVQFFIVVPRADALLPTVLSRVQINRSTADTEVDSVEMHAFLHMSYKERLECIAKKVKDKDNSWISAIVAGAEIFASQSSREDPQLANMVLMIRRYIAFPGASKKMLLEGLALQLPLRQ